MIMKKKWIIILAIVFLLINDLSLYAEVGILEKLNDPLYLSLLDKKLQKNNLIMEENNLCNQIAEQERINAEIVQKIKGTAFSYNSPYNKIINDIKVLLDLVRTKKVLNFQLINTDIDNTTNTLIEETELFHNQINNLNFAIKALRESIKYISLDSKIFYINMEATQKN